ncbi:Fibronectin type III domain-containing protein [Rheinheimera pacifica]|uniref:Fibronectin type III domain-containing protein n=1 Tax=Rheinheimera pacifica TaxID=173990 RepID=A0A1H6NI19_9GAMM|nr:Ig-like domain-containing protein [Rheinheimera pacifica]SEI12628.1 Fibronectin type III domain-containing protein [Rheinheimera pacifica]
MSLATISFSAQAAEQSLPANKTTWVFVDPAVKDYQQLIGDLPADAELRILQADRDGISQIAEELYGQRNIAQIHLISHGRDGEIQAGNTWLSLDNIQAKSSDLSQIGTALGNSGSLYIYGCQVAYGSKGKHFLNEIARYTGANIAASENWTGSYLHGGDWVLERTIGDVDLSRALASVDYPHVLATLNAGDMVVLGINARSDTQAIHFATLVNIPAGTVIKITDRGWDQAGGGAFTPPGTGDGVIVWTTSEPYSAGTLFRLVLGGSDDVPPTQLVNITAGNTDLTDDISIDIAYYTVANAMTIGGEQIFIYQDSDTNPYFIFGLNASRNTNLDANFWQTAITATLVESMIPNGVGSQNALTNGSNAVGLLTNPGAVGAGFQQFDNVAYTGPTSSTDRTGWLARIANRNNWGGDDDGTVTTSVGTAGGSFIALPPPPPTVTDGNISISGATGTGGAYKIGDTISATWNNTAGGDNNPGITGVTADFTQFGGGAAVAATNNASIWTASYTIAAGAIDAINRNVSITANNADGPTTTADTSNATVDNIAPTVTDANISISGATGLGGTYIVGDTVTATWNNTAGGDNNSDTISGVTVNFSQFGGGTVAATNSAGTWTATYTIAAGAIEAAGRNISVTATDNAGNSTTRADTSNVDVDNVVPTVASVSVPANGTYIAGQSLDFIVNTSENIILDTTGGTPRIALTVGATTRYATYLSGSGTSAIVFRYTVQSGDFDPNGITVTAVIQANGGTLKDGAGNNMNLTLNSVGSTASVLVDGLTVPDAPIIGIATAGNAQASVTFSAPANNGGSAITAYTAIASPGGASGNCAGPAACVITVNGLTNGTAYTFTVTATNVKGNSASSAASKAVTPKANQTITFNDPGAQNFGTSPTLVASSSAGGGYVVTFSSATPAICTVSGATLSFVAAGSCTIDANQPGDAAISAAATVSRTFTVNAVVPSAPTIGTAIAGDTQASVAFVAPVNIGGSAITGYTVTVNPADVAPIIGASSPIVVTGLTNGQAYTFTVTANNVAGTGPASAASNSVTPAAIQTITFNNPGTQNFGTTPTLTATSDSGLTPTFTSATPAVCTITSGGALTFVTAGSCTINADQAGNGSYLPAPQVSQTFTVTPVAPGIPTAVVATAGDTTASVAFAAPVNTGGVNITGYTVTSTPGGLTASGAGSPLVVNGLTNGTAYTFTVTAANTAGTGHPSAASNAVTPNPANSAPQISGSPATSVDQGQAYSFVPTVTDPDGDTLTFSIQNKPTWASFDTATGALTGTPAKEHVGTTTGIVISVSDGEFSASLAAFSIEVISVNAAPVAVDDNFTLPFSNNHTYLLDVLANDTDPDGDSLTITAAKASIGLVSIQANKLQFNAPENFSGTATFSYSITDGEFSDQAKVTLQIDGSNPDAPVITPPDDLIVNASGLFTKVNVGVATAVDRNGNRLAVSLVNGSPLFASGRHELYWRATDASGVSSTVTQLLQINPLVSLSKPQTVINNSTATIEVILNGPSPVYPLEVAYSVSGSASAVTEHNLAAGSVQISSGLRASISFDVFADLTTQAEKDIVVTLSSSLNLGANASTTITATEANLAPVVMLEAQQQNQIRLTVGKTAGVVTVAAQVTDPNPGDTVSLQWQADAALTNISNDISQFVFDPANLSSGVYQIALTATDNAAEPLSYTAQVYLLVQDVLPVLDGSDSNNNLIPDNVEGLGDSNGNGIPDYLDPGFDCNVMPEQLLTVTQFVAEGEPGICLRKGATAALSNTGGIQLTSADLQWLEPDMQATNIGGTFDFILRNLPTAGASYALVLPQRQPVPQNAVYRKYTQATGWTNFVQNERNQLLSAAGEPGFCPPPGSSNWQPGLTAGHWCIQLTIEDGGPNDADGLANSTIVDPGGVAVVLNGNQLPVATDDSYSVQWNQSHTLEVLQNDTDPDGDTLSINQAAAAFGTVSISGDGQTLLYTPAQDFIGTDTLSYGISDGNNGSASATVTVEVYYNRPPLVSNATASTNDKTAIDIDVLANASDPDGDTLVISSASAQNGTVTITAAQTLRYTPQAGYTGTDTISFTVSDQRGGSVNGTVTISITAYEVITVVNKSSGGALNGWPLLLLAGLALGRRRKMLLKPVLLLAALLSFNTQANWSLDVMFGKSTTRQSTSEILAQLPANAELLQYDDSGKSWALGLSYYFTPRLAVQAHYVDLGDASVSMRGETLTPEAFHQAVSDIGPMLAKGVRSGLSYHVWQHAGWSATVQAGVFAWNSETNSTAGDNLIRYKTSDTDIYWALGASYALDEHIALQAVFNRYHLEGNKADNIMLGVSYSF